MHGGQLELLSRARPQSSTPPPRSKQRRSNDGNRALDAADAQQPGRAAAAKLEQQEAPAGQPGQANSPHYQLLQQLAAAQQQAGSAGRRREAAALQLPLQDVKQHEQQQREGRTAVALAAAAGAGPAVSAAHAGALAPPTLPGVPVVSELGSLPSLGLPLMSGGLSELLAGKSRSLHRPQSQGVGCSRLVVKAHCMLARPLHCGCTVMALLMACQPTTPSPSPDAAMRQGTSLSLPAGCPALQAGPP